jgi:hypothetical protein
MASQWSVARHVERDQLLRGADEESMIALASQSWPMPPFPPVCFGLMRRHGILRRMHTDRPRLPHEILMTALAGLVVVAICLAFAWHEPRFFWNDDCQMTFIPVFEEVNRAWRAGEWPLLTQSSWVCGNLAGEYQYGTFSIFINLCILAIWSLGLPLAGKAAALAIVHEFVLATGAFMLARSRGLGPPLATFVALVAALNGWIVCWGATNWIPGLTSFAWLPWAWWALEQAAPGSPLSWRGRWVAAAAVFLYLSLTAGWPFTTLMLLVLTAWIALRRLAAGAGLKPLLPLIAAWTLGGLMALPALWLLVEYVQGSERAGGGPGLNWTWTVPLEAWPAMLAPTAPTIWKSFYANMPHMPLELANGFAPLVMLVVGLALAPRPWRRDWPWLVGLASLLAAIATLPSAGVFRWSFRWLPLFHLVLAITAAGMWQAIDGRASGAVIATDAVPARRAAAPRSPWLRWRHAGGLVAVALGLGYLAACGWSLPQFDLHMLDLAIVAAAWTALGLAATARPGIPAFAAIRPWLPAAVVAAAVMSLFLRVPPNLAVPVFPFDESFLAAAPLDRDRLHMSLYLEEDLPTSKLPPGSLGQAFRPGNSALLAGIRMINGYSPIHPRGISTMLPFETHGQMFPEAVRWVFAEGAGAGDVLATIGVDALVVSKHAARLGRLPEAEWEKLWSGTEADVYHRRGISGRSAAVLSPDAAAEQSPRRAPLVTDTRHRAAIDLAAAAAPRLVVFPRPWYAGWQATLDGRPLATIAYKNVAIAAAVPADAAGRVAIAYRPAGFTLGIPIALVAALVTLGIAARRAPPHLRDGSSSSISETTNEANTS